MLSIRPLENYIDTPALPIFEEFFDEYPKLNRQREKHDELWAALLENCRVAFDSLLESSDFQEKVRMTLSEFPEYPGGAVPREDFVKLIAQYVVNNIRQLPSHYTTAHFWSRFGQEFLALRTPEAFNRLDASGHQFLEFDGKLVTTFKNFGSELRKEYDIPAAPVDTILSRRRRSV